MSIGVPPGAQRLGASAAEGTPVHQSDALLASWWQEAKALLLAFTEVSSPGQVVSLSPGVSYQWDLTLEPLPRTLSFSWTSSGGLPLPRSGPQRTTGLLRSQPGNPVPASLSKALGVTCHSSEEVG